MAAEGPWKAGVQRFQDIQWFTDPLALPFKIPNQVVNAHDAAARTKMVGCLALPKRYSTL